MYTGGINVQFYEKKIRQLEEENHYNQEELSKCRSRLRAAQDYEIKYEILLKSSQSDMLKLKQNAQRNEQIKREEYLSVKLKQCNDNWKKQMKQFEDKIMKQSQEELSLAKSKLEQANSDLAALSKRSQEIELFNFKIKKFEKQNQNLREQLEDTKIYLEQKKVQQISSLKNHLTNSYRQKISNDRAKYQIKITELQKRLTELQIQKDSQIFQVSGNTNSQLDLLKKALQEKEAEQERQVEQIKNLLQSKNYQIKQLLIQKSQTEFKHRQQLLQKRQNVKELQQILLKKEREHQIEMYNLIHRINATKEDQITELKNQIKRLNQDLNREHAMWNQKIINQDKELETVARQFEDQKKKLVQQKNIHKRKVSELSIKMKQVEGERQMGDTQMLINSLKDTDMKDQQMGNYDNGITFLQRQLKKCQIKLEERTRTISKLYKDINNIRSQTQHQMSELKQKMRKEKKEATDRIVNLQHELRDVTDQLRMKEREDRKKQRQSFRQKTDLEQQNKSLKDLIDQLQRDYNRVIENKKGVETSYRQERQKCFTSKGDVNIIKKQKWLQLQKQKSDLQIIFKEKQEQLKLQYEQQIDDLTNQLNKLKQRLEITEKQNDLLNRQNQRLQQALELNKENDKYAEFNKKLATLNLEIALTQNIYESLKKVKKSSGLSESLANSLGQIDIKSDSHSNGDDREPLLMSFHPSCNKML